MNRYKTNTAMMSLVFRESVHSFNANRGLQSAAMLAYYGFLFLMPMLLLVVFTLSHIAAWSERVLTALSETIRWLHPEFADAVLRDMMKIAGDKAWGVATIIALLWSLMARSNCAKAGKLVKTARTGDYFGEMSLLLQVPRTATAVAHGESRVVVISSANYETIVRENPVIVMKLLQEMGRRLKTTTDALAAHAAGR